MTMDATGLGPSEPSVRRAARPVYLLTLAGTLAWLATIVLAPVLKSRTSAAAVFLYALFSPICHQIPERSFSLCGQPLAVCGRCLGIYAGFLAGLVIYPFVRGFGRIALPTPHAFVIASLPVGLDFLFGFLGLWDSPIGARFATGLLWGGLMPFYFVTGLSELLLRRAGRRAPEGRVPGGNGPTLDSPGRNALK